MSETPAPPSAAPPHQQLSYWLHLVESLLSTQIGESLEEHGLTRAQWQLMNALTSRPQTTEELEVALPEPSAADPADPDGPQSIEEHLEELVDSGWLVHEGELYTLTSTGRASGERVAAVVEELRAQVTDGIGSEEYQVAVSVLQRVAGNLGYTGVGAGNGQGNASAAEDAGDVEPEPRSDAG